MLAGEGRHRIALEKSKDKDIETGVFGFEIFSKENSNKLIKILVYNQKEIEERITLLFMEFLGHEIIDKSLQSESK